ncbi:MAG: isocitrate lyase/phosphoenolpyruvate mutase family protein [Hyphomicrobiaceae bacterium]
MSKDIGAAFRALHERDDLFVIANPWDIGSARLAAAVGFEALATTSAGMAFAIGKGDGEVSRAEALAHAAAIVAATALPVSADFEKGYGDSPEAVASLIRDAGAIGLAGCSIEDATGRAEAPIYEDGLAVERISAAVEAARGLGRDFVLTARCENFLWNRPDLDATIRRLEAYEAAGADVLFAPGLRTIEEVRAVVGALERPVNVLNGIPGMVLPIDQLRDAGVKRVSLGPALAKVAYEGMVKAAEAVMAGDYAFVETLKPSSALVSRFRKGAA